MHEGREPTGIRPRPAAAAEAAAPARDAPREGALATRNAGLERLYLRLAIPIGLFFVLVNAPFIGVPDELSHFYKALALAQGHVLPSGDARAPRDYVEFRWTLTRLDPRVEGFHEMQRPAFRRALTEPPREEQTSVPARVGFAPPLAYVPQALALRLALLVGAPPLVALYLGRLFAFALTTWLVACAIRRAPYGKLVFLLVGLLPMTVQQVASFSYGGLHVAALLLLTAHLLALSERAGRLTPGELVRTGAGAVLASIVKPGYLAVTLLVLALPRRAFRSRAAHLGYALALLAASAGAHLLSRRYYGEGAPGVRLDPPGQAQKLLGDPLEFLVVLGRTLDRFAWQYWEGIVFLSGRLVALPSAFYALVTCGFLLLLLADPEERRPARSRRWLLGGVALAQAACLFALFYVFCTSTSITHVQGIQGRYFLGLLPAALLALRPALLAALRPAGLAALRARVGTRIVPAVVAFELLVHGYAGAWIVRYYY